MNELINEQKREEKWENQKVRCKKCNSSFVYIRIAKKEVVCRSCGHISPMGE